MRIELIDVPFDGFGRDGHQARAGEYAQKTDREIPVVLLTPVDGPGTHASK